MKQILIVDDASTIRLYLKHLLEGAGYAVDEAANGVEALEKVLYGTYDLCLVDVNMPKLDGYSFLREFRSRDVAQPPVIMVSTEAQLTDRSEALRCGANGYLVKPVAPEPLLSLVGMLTPEGT